MKTRFIQIVTLLLLLGGPGLAGAATVATPPQAETATTEQQAPLDRDRLAWQRVGSPTTLEG